MTEYVKKNPPIRILLDNESFNYFCQLLYNMTLIQDEKIKTDSNKLLNKVLKYSVIHQEENEISIDIRLFISEATSLIQIMLSNNICNINTARNFVEELRENKKNL